MSSDKLDSLSESYIFAKAKISKDVSVEFYINDFLEALSNSILNKFIVKGCMALKYSMSYIDKAEFRGTSDLDLHVFNKEDWEIFIENCCNNATENSPNGIKYTLLGRRGFTTNPRGDKLTIQANSIQFTVDMNLGPDVDFYLNENNGLRFYSIPSILCDKLHVLSSRKACRRIKDLIDVYFIATNFDLNYYDICSIIKCRMESTGKCLSPEGIFIYDQANFDNLEHAFNKYSESVKIDKSFEEVLDVVQGFTFPIYRFMYGNMFNYTFWKKDVVKWE